jgi:hypothetical protein
MMIIKKKAMNALLLRAMGLLNLAKALIYSKILKKRVKNKIKNWYIVQV